MRIKLDIPLSISEIYKTTKSFSAPIYNKEVNYITTDSRELLPGDLFICLRGEKYDGNDFSEEAFRLGAIPLSERRLPFAITVNNSEKALMSIARLYKSKLKSLKNTVAVTGSVGKSTTTGFLKLILEKYFKVSSTYKNYNNRLGSSLSVLSAKRDTELLILEMGMNHKSEIRELSKAFEPGFAIITNIGTSHIGNLGSRAAIAEAKLEVLSGMRTNDLLVPFSEPLLNQKGKYSFSCSEISSDFFLKAQYGDLDFYYNKRRVLSATFALSEAHYCKCLCPAVAAALLIGCPTEYVIDGIERIGRADVRGKFKHIGELTVYEDCYNASLESLSAVFKYASSLPGYNTKSALIGSVLELGTECTDIHLEIGRRAASFGFEKLYLFGDHAALMADGARQKGFSSDKTHIFPDICSHSEVADAILGSVRSRELLLVKGSRKMMLEKVIEELEKRQQNA